MNEIRERLGISRKEACLMLSWGAYSVIKEVIEVKESESGVNGEKKKRRGEKVTVVRSKEITREIEKAK